MALISLDSGEMFSLPIGETAIGRGSFFRIKELTLSRSHAILSFNNGKLSIKPMHKNPTYFYSSSSDDQQQQVQLQKDQWNDLKDGDEISLMANLYRYRFVTDQENRINTADSALISYDVASTCESEPVRCDDQVVLRHEGVVQNSLKTVQRNQTISDSACKEVRLPSCPYGRSCYRKNPAHFTEFSHLFPEKRNIDINRSSHINASPATTNKTNTTNNSDNTTIPHHHHHSPQYRNQKQHQRQQKQQQQHQQQKQQPQHQQQRCNKNQSQQQQMRCEHQTPEIECECKSVAVMRTTVKEGPNKGRQFYCCQKKNGVSCNFFLWADDIVSVQRCLHGQGVKRKLSDITTPQRGRTLVHKADGNSPNSTYYHVSSTSSHEED